MGRVKSEERWGEVGESGEGQVGKEGERVGE